MDAHASSAHFCGADNPGYQAMLRAMRNDYDESREMLTECSICRDDVIRRANSPVLYDVHGFYGLQGDSAVHNCAERETPPTPIRQQAASLKEEPEPVSIRRPRPKALD
jgi:hypothetical protein